LHFTQQHPSSSEKVEGSCWRPDQRCDLASSDLICNQQSVSQWSEKIASAMATFPGAADFVIGLIGMGDMGKMYARRLSSAGWR
jgi:hypothetical protein